jgi:hypothetical protein
MIQSVVPQDWLPRGAGVGFGPRARYKRSVPAVALWRWVLLRLVSQPLVGAFWLLLLMGPAALRQLAPVPSSRSSLELALAWVFPAGLVGATLGLVTLSSGAQFLARLDPRTRFQGELGGLWLSIAYLHLPILSGALAAGASAGDLARALPAILTADLHLAGISLVLQLPPLSTALRATLLLSAVWLVPALCAGDPTLARAAALLDAGAALREEAPALPSAAAALVPILAAYLLRTNSPRPRSG